MKDSIHNKRFTLRGKALDVSAPLVMGILNVTPDSFSDGGSYATLQSAIKRVDEMISQGADIIDIGGESTRPGSDPVPEDEELERVIPVLKEVIQRHPRVIFSLDTTKYNVARQGLESGVHIINDVSGLQNEPRIAELCAEFGAGLIIMHSPGNPKTMQNNPVYDDVVADIIRFLRKQCELAGSAGVDAIMVDPGIGFGKTLEHNLKLLAGVDKLVELGYPVLIGASRKSMFVKLLGSREPSERVAATLAAHYHTLMLGASILRVHDVPEAKDSIEVFKAVQNQK